MSAERRGSTPTTARERWLAFRRTLPPTPRLTRRDVSVRGLTFATWHTPPSETNPVPLVCVNGGLLFDHGLLWPALAPLAAHRQLIFYDQRGRGESSVPPGLAASRIEFDAGDLVALREALGIGRWDVLGHSWGGGIAMLAASLDPDGVRQLVLANAVGLASSWLSGLHNAGVARLAQLGLDEAAEKLASLNPDALAEPDLERHAVYSQSFFPAWFADADFAARSVPPLGRSITGAHVAARLRRQGYDWTARMSALRSPTLVLHGADDVLPVHEGEHTTSSLRAAGVAVQFESLPGAGHNPFWESPSRFFAAVQAFLTPT